MTTRQLFRNTMAERRQFQRGSVDHEYRTRAARQLVWMLRGVPTNQWGEMT